MAHLTYLNSSDQVTDIMSFVKARSPIILSLVTTGGDTFTSINIKLTMYNGAFASIPATASYEFYEDTQAFTSRGSFNYDLSAYVKEYLKDVYTQTPDNMATWVKIYVDAQDTGTSTSPYTIYALALNGYVDFEDNYVNFSGGVLESERAPVQLYLGSEEISISAGRTYTIPMLNPWKVGQPTGFTSSVYDGFKSYSLEYSNGTVNNYNLSITPSANPSTGEIFEYFTLTLPVDANSATITCYSGLTQSGDIAYTYTFREKPNSKYNKYQIQYFDKNGTLAYIHCDGATKFTQAVNRSEYSPTNMLNSVGSWDTDKPQMNMYNINGIESFTINTGFVPETYKEVIRELLLSENVWLRTENPQDQCVDYFDELEADGYVIESAACTNAAITALGGSVPITTKATGYTYTKVPIMPMDTNMKMQQSIIDGMINYELSFKYAYNKINNLF